MKRAFTVAAIVLMSGTIFSSCKKLYNCECTDNNGKVSRHSVNATNRSEASKNCRDVSRIADCEIK